HLRKLRNDASNWADSYMPANEYREHGWLTAFADAFEEAADRLTSQEPWRPIESAPKGGSLIFLRSAETGRCNLGKWNADGTSWVDENGLLGGDCYTLAVTGIWESGGGWFQPNEVTHWAPLPAPPRSTEESGS